MLIGSVAGKFVIEPPRFHASSGISFASLNQQSGMPIARRKSKSHPPSSEAPMPGRPETSSAMVRLGGGWCG